ncbi:TniQ family protein [Paenibacillus chitinolyticus]|uniref:TniQ family protein n=1 Tax=Paenibacillus chitinolyticus TaxID=79263 RepID=UPI00366DFFBC
MLLLRPNPFHEESLRGFIVRCSEANNLDSNFLFRFLGLQKYNKFVNLLIPDKSLDLTQMSELTGKAPQTLKALTLYNQLFEERLFENEFTRFPIWRYGTCIQRQRVCPECLRVDPHHKNIWELSLVTVCSIHKCMLLDRCDSCGQRINPYRDRICRCKCTHRSKRMLGKDCRSCNGNTANTAIHETPPL